MPIFRTVADGPELQRVFGLPRRPIPDPDSPDAKALARELTVLLRRVPVPYPFRSEADSLYATQALALQELYETGGLVAPIAAGRGKSLMFYLAIAILKPKRPMLLVPANMVTDTEVEWRRFEEDWRGPRFEDVTLLSYERVSNPSSGAKVLPDGTLIYDDIITRHRPDFIGMDECDRLGNTDATGTRRVGRYLESAEGQECVVLGASGTLIRRSLSDAAHVMQWCLGDQAPLPCEFTELQAMSEATDPRNIKGKRTEFGALLDYLSPEEMAAVDQAESSDDARGAVCAAIGTRILETKGVIGSADGPLTIPARFDPWYVSDPDDVIEAEYARLMDGDDERAAWSLPDGTLLPDARSLARPLNTLGFGFHLLQDPKPPELYSFARSSWNSAVREVIKYQSHLRLDSEWMVRNAVLTGVLPVLRPILDTWLAEKAAYTASTGLAEPPSVPVWLSDEVVHEVARWLKEGTGLVWVGYIALGERLSKELGISYFGGAKTDAKGRHVTKLKRGEPAVLSVASCGRGTNGLQFCHSRQLWLTSPSEQSLARVHRAGQDAECVKNDIYVGGGAHLARFWRAHALARNFAGAVSKQAQRIEYFQNFVPRAVTEEGRRWVAGNAEALADVGEDA